MLAKTLNGLFAHPLSGDISGDLLMGQVQITLPTPDADSGFADDYQPPDSLPPQRGFVIRLYGE